MTSDDLRTYFSQYGEVAEVYLPKPFRAFAFVTFDDPAVANGLCGDDHIINGVSIHVSSATPKGAGMGMDAWGGAREGFGNRKTRFVAEGFSGSSGGAARGGKRNPAQGGFNNGGMAQGFGGMGNNFGAMGNAGGFGGFSGGMGNAGGNGMGNVNQVQLNNAMMAAAQAALFGFMTQAAGGAQFGGGGAAAFGGAGVGSNNLQGGQGNTGANNAGGASGFGQNNSSGFNTTPSRFGIGPGVGQSAEVCASQPVGGGYAGVESASDGSSMTPNNQMITGGQRGWSGGSMGGGGGMQAMDTQQNVPPRWN